MSYEERAARGARNQSLFRTVNERVKELNDAFSIAVPHGDWVCECANDGCSDRLALTTEEYEAVRGDPRRFFVSPDDEHVFPEIEAVVDEQDRFWVVEKTGQAGDLAAMVDPRTLDST